MRRFLSLLMTLCLPLTAFAGNIKDTDLITSNTFERSANPLVNRLF